MPTYANVSPAASSTISPATSLVFDVTDAGGLASVFVYVTYEDGGTEVVWTGDGFGPRFSSSTRVAITDGFTFTVNRVGGWGASPMLRAVAIPVAGSNENLAVDYILAALPAKAPRPVVGGPLGAGPSATLLVVLGQGVVAPFRRDGKGDVAHASDLALIRSNLGQVLGTLASSDYTIGELPWRPEFGSLLYLLRFRNNDAILRELAETYVVDAVELWEPRVRIKRVRIGQDPDKGILEISIVYDVVSRRRTVVVSNVQQSFTSPLETT